MSKPRVSRLHPVYRWFRGENTPKSPETSVFAGPEDGHEWSPRHRERPVPFPSTLQNPETARKHVFSAEITCSGRRQPVCFTQPGLFRLKPGIWLPK